MFLPMFFYLNPFSWIKRFPRYESSQKTSNLLYDLNIKYNLKMEIGDVNDTLWYFRDLKNDKISKLENFELLLDKDSLKNTDLETVKKYVNEFSSNFEYRNYFDSIQVAINYDSIIYKTKMR